MAIAQGQSEEISVMEAAHRLGVWVGHAYQLIWNERLRARKVGRRWLVDAASVAERLKQVATKDQ